MWYWPLNWQSIGQRVREWAHSHTTLLVEIYTGRAILRNT